MQKVFEGILEKSNSTSSYKWTIKQTKKEYKII